jgi:hypothetical protein
MNNERIMQFQLQIANKTLESVYINNDGNSKFSSFLLTFLNIFEVSFPVICKIIHRNRNV